MTLEKDQFDFQIQLRDKETFSGDKKSASTFLKIFLHHDVYQKISAFSLADTSVERGGVLLGRLFTLDKGEEVVYLILIEAMVKALHTRSTKTSVTFTHETWQHIYQEKDTYYPNYQILGWFHTHPGFGVFLSGYDLFILNTFFSEPWQVSYVVDPVAKKDGFFRKEPLTGKIEECHDISLLGPKVIEERQIEAKKTKEKPVELLKKEDTFKKKSYSPLPFISSILLLLLLGSLFYLLHGFNDGLNLLRSDLLALEGEVAKSPNGPLLEEIKILQGQILEMEKDISFFLSAKPSIEEEDVKEKTYILIREGDTLWSISETFLGSSDYVKELALINHMKDDLLLIGERLLLPIE